MTAPTHERRRIPGIIRQYTIDADGVVWSACSGEVVRMTPRRSKDGGLAVEVTRPDGERVKRSPRTMLRLAFPELAEALDAEDYAARVARAAHARAAQAEKRR